MIVLILMSVMILLSAVLMPDVQIVSPVTVVHVIAVTKRMLTEIALTKMSATETEYSLVTKKTKDSVQILSADIRVPVIPDMKNLDVKMKTVRFSLVRM